MKVSLEVRLKKFKDFGWKYVPETGEVISHMDKPIKGKLIRLITYYHEINQVPKNSFAWYYMTGEITTQIYHIDQDPTNFKWSNLTLSRIQNRIYTKKPRRKKPKVTVTVVKKNKNKNYLNKIDLTKEIIISQGKGYLTENAKTMLFIMANEMIKKFDYYNMGTYEAEQNQYDCMMTGFVMMLENWKNYNSHKYLDAFPYFSEILKRGIVRGYNALHGKFNPNIEMPKIVSLNNFVTV